MNIVVFMRNTFVIQYLTNGTSYFFYLQLEAFFTNSEEFRINAGVQCVIFI